MGDQASMEHVPESLRAGSPVIARGETPFQNYATRASPTSYTESPISPLAPDPAFHRTSRSRSLLNRLGTLRSSRRRSRYGAVEDDDDQEALNPPGGRLRDLEEEGNGESIGFDVSAFEGPIQMRQIDKKGTTTTTKEVEEEEIDSAYAGLASEFHRLETEDRERAALGSGMNTVVDATSTEEDQPGHRRINSGVDNQTHDDAQKVAEKRGEIVAVTETPAMDVSILGGAEFDSRNVLNNLHGPDGNQEKSYFFPDDPDKPSWRPMSMHWAYIATLVGIALGLAGLQEYLCQESIEKAKHNDGLIRFKQPQEISMTLYFTWKYLPTLVLVSYGVMWQISDFEVKRLEPYYQLSKKNGATAAESLNIDYLTFFSYLAPLKAIRYRQWAVVLSSSSTLIAGSLVPVLQSAAVYMYPDKEKRREDEDKFVRVDPVWSRLTTAFLLVVAINGLALLFQLRRKSGLLSDPKGIAGIAAMATRSHILNDFQGLDVAPPSRIHRKLRNRRYILHKSSLWQGEYIRSAADDLKEHKDKNPLPPLLTIPVGIAYIACLLAFAVLIPIFMFVPAANVVTEKLPFLLTAIATGLKLLWGTLDCDVRMIEPFYILSRQRSSPRTLTLDYTGTMPGWLPIRAALDGHYLVALTGLGAVMTEVLTVCVSSFSVDGQKFFPGHGRGDPGDPMNGPGRPPPNTDQSNDRYNGDQTFKSFWVSLALAIGILLSLCAIAALVYVYRSKKFLPRQPSTIASVLAFIHQSKMLDDFVGTEKMDSHQMTKHLEGLGKTYALGWFRGRDGEDHCGLEEEPLLAVYKHGVDWRKGRLGSLASQQWEYL